MRTRITARTPMYERQAEKMKLRSVNKCGVVLVGLFAFTLSFAASRAEAYNWNANAVQISNIKIYGAQAKVLITTTANLSGVGDACDGQHFVVIRNTTTNHDMMYSAALAAFLAGKKITVYAQWNASQGECDVDRLSIQN